MAYNAARGYFTIHMGLAGRLEKPPPMIKQVQNVLYPVAAVVVDDDDDDDSLSYTQ
jgi:hypothetical protein